MKIADANVLLYAHNSASKHHEKSRIWLRDSLSEAEPTGLAWVALVAFLRIGTNSAIFPRPFEPDEALDLIDSWLDHPGTQLVEPGREHRRILRELVESAGTAGNLTTDAHIAAIAIENGATLASFDADFHRFKSLRFEYLG
ncbi:MAG: TA system VapC family ribonuclease toxin [Solirubrobacterales bacterium]